MRFEGDVPWDEFTVVTAADIPGANRIALILDDQPYLADGVVNHPEEPVVLLAHADKSLRRAKRVVASSIDIEPLPAVFTIDDALDGADRGLGRRQHLQVATSSSSGDVDAALAQAAHVVEGEYETGAQEQLYIEPQRHDRRRRARRTASPSGDRCSARTTSTRR